MRSKILQLSVVLACTLAARVASGQDPGFGFRHQTGGGIGYDISFSSFEWFQPLTETHNDMIFLNNRGIVNNTGFMGNNLGLGYRWYSPTLDRMFGFFGYYDVRDTQFDLFHQASVGFDSVGDAWDLHANLYIPVKPQDTTIVGDFSDPFFLASNLVRSRLSTTISAMPGFDTEMGVPLPVPFNVRAYAGWYGYEPSDHGTQFGWRGRLEASVTDTVNLGLAVSDDSLFGTNTVFHVAWQWRGITPRLGFNQETEAIRGTAYQRLATPVQRNHNIVVGVSRSDAEIQTLTDPSTGSAIIVRHVDNRAPAGGDGTVERPANSLLAAEGISTPNDIIYVTGNPGLLDANGNIAGMSSGIILAPGQRLLANGFHHFVDTVELGTILLPGFDPAAAGQTITNSDSVSDVITLASNNEVSGFNVIDAIGNDTISGENITGANINRNTIISAPGRILNAGVGIRLFDVFGTVNIGVPDPRDDGTLTPATPAVAWGNTISGHPDGGIDFNKPAQLGGVGGTTLNIFNNTITFNGDGIPNPAVLPQLPVLTSDNGISIVAQNVSSVDATVQNNIISNNGGVFGGTALGDGIHIEGQDAFVAFDGLTMNVDVIGNTITGNAGHGIFAAANSDDQDNLDVAVVTLGIQGNLIDSNGSSVAGQPLGDGIHIEASAGGQVLLAGAGGLGISGNTITNNIVNGITLTAFGDGNSFIGGFIGDNVIDFNGDPADPIVAGRVGNGIQIDLAGDTLDFVTRINLDIERNEILGNRNNGVEINAIDNGDMIVTIQDSNVIDFNGTIFAANAVGSGIDAELNDDSTLSLAVLNNTSISNNAVDGVVLTANDNAGNTNNSVLPVELNVSGNDAINGNGAFVLGNPVGNGVHVVMNDDSVLQVQVRDNLSISGNLQNGVFVEAHDDTGAAEPTIGQNLLAITDNNIDFNGNPSFNGTTIGNGILVTAQDGSGLNFGNRFLDAAIRGNSLTGNALNGIQVVAQDDAVVTADILNNTVTGDLTASVAPANGDHGIFVQTSDDTTFDGEINGNTVQDNGRDGIRVDADSDDDLFLITRNTVRNNLEDGIAFNATQTNVNPVQINGNFFVEDNGRNGIIFNSLAGGATVEINRNANVRNNGRDGIVFRAPVGSDANRVEINSNTNVDSNENGILLVTAGDDNTYFIDNNTLDGNTFHGIRHINSGDNNDGEINDNVVTNSGLNGMLFNVTGTNGDVDVLGNTVQFNGIDGIRYVASGAATGNTLQIDDSPANASIISDNGGVGISTLLSGTAGVLVRVENVTLTDNGLEGFRADTANTSTLGLRLLDNTASGNGGASDYRFREVGANNGFQFENPFFDEALPFPLYQAGSQVSGTFSFDNLDGDEDVPLGTFVFP